MSNPTVTWLRFCRFIERNLYFIVPPVIGLMILALMVILVYSAISALNETNKVILSIPRLVQTEMAKTRRVLREEADSSRQTVVGQHQMTRDEIGRQSANADVARHKTMKALDSLRKQVEAPEPPRRKILGLF